MDETKTLEAPASVESSAKEDSTSKRPEAGRRGGQRLAVLKTYKLYVGGKFPRSESGRYDKVKNADGSTLANVCRASRKDLREAVVAARNAQAGWAKLSGYNRGQILYRAAEMLEGRQGQFVTELTQQGLVEDEAEAEVTQAIDRLVYYAGWADKYQQIFSCVNPVSSSHFNFSLLEPVGVVGVLGPQRSPLLGLISVLAPTIVGGNTAVLLATEDKPLSAITLAEVLSSSDVPPGVVNILTGRRYELVGQFATHMDLNAVIYCGQDAKEVEKVQAEAALNVKRVILHSQTDWRGDDCQTPYWIQDCQELKTIWHPVGV